MCSQTHYAPYFTGTSPVRRQDYKEPCMFVTRQVGSGTPAVAVYSTRETVLIYWAPQFLRNLLSLFSAFLFNVYGK